MYQELIKKYENELKDNIVPFWQNHCIDKEFGGYFTSLDRDGSVYDTTKYMWMQWRIVYMFGELYLNPLYRKDEFLSIAKEGFDFLYKNGRNDKGQYYFALNRQGVPAIAPYNVFSDCFAAMGAAVLYKATHESIYKKAANAAMNSYITRVASENPAMQWNKALSGKQSYLAHGEYMMMANLGMIMDDCLGGNKYDKELDNAMDMVLNKFYQPAYKTVFENILPDGSLDMASCQGRMLNPGHVLESMWFMLNAAMKQGDSKKTEQKVCAIILSTLNLGWDKKEGGIFYFMDALNKPHIELQHDMKLWWVHNEALIACLFAYKSSRNPIFMQWFKKVDNYTWSHFKDTDYPEWFGYLNRAGTPTHLLKGGKWKTFFHLPRCMMMCSKLLRELEEM
ncbi:MAG: AGE family epimerase/isomerase [Lentisphaeria bacterium]